MVQQVEVSSVQEVLEGSVVCSHHLADSGSGPGPTSGGMCRICGEIREFKNYVETASWGDTRLMPSSQAPVRPQVAITSDDSWDDE